MGGQIDLSNYYTTTQTDSLLSNKVDKVSGKGLSTNDYTTAEKNKLAGIDLTNYVTNTDYSGTEVAGVIKSSVNGFIVGNTGNPGVSVYTYQQYASALSDNHFIGKGTLQNVLNAVVGDINTLLDEINGEVI